VSDPACAPPAALGDVNWETSDNGSPQSQQGQQVNNPACTDGGQPYSEKRRTTGRVGQKRGVKVKKNGNWTNAAMAAAISAMDGGMGAYLDPP
jgi:hypothetical protein